MISSITVVVMTRGGYIKRMPLKTFENQRRGTRGKSSTNSKKNASADNEVSHCVACNDHDTLLMMSQNGVAYGIRAYQIPTAGRTAKGSPLPSVLPIRSDQRITSILPVSDFSDDEYVVLATEQGWIKKTALSAFEKMNSRGLIIATLADGDQLKWCQRCKDGDDLLIGSSKGQATRIESANVRPSGRTSRGVRAMKLREGDTLADMNVIESAGGSAATNVLCVTSKGYGKRISTDDFRTINRGGSGVIAIKFKKGLEEEDRVSCFCVVQEDDEVLINTSRGIMVRQKVNQISLQSRQATGVTVQKVDDGDHISSISLVPKYEEQDEP